MFILLFSSSFMFVIGDDNVTCHTITNVISGDGGET